MPPDSPCDWSDIALVRQCISGDAGAWDELLTRYSPMIYGISRRFRLSPEDCVDVFGQVCRILLENLHKLRRAERLAGYVATTTRRECLAVLRCQQKNQRLSGALEPGEPAVNGSDAEADGVARAALRGHMVRRTLQVQEPKCRELLRFLFFDEEEPDYAEISRKMNMPVSSIGPTRSRCLEKFRKALEKMGFNE